MSIVRVGLAETKHFSEGYEAIFGKQKTEVEKKEASPRKAKASAKAGKKKKSKKK